MQNEVVLLHGWGMNKQVWQLIETELAAELKRPVRALNLPGFGGEALPETHYDLDAIVESIDTFIQPNSIVIGWSLGGLVATRLAATRPDKVAHLVLVASNVQFCESDIWPGIKPDVLAQFKVQLAKDSRKTIERFLAIQAMGSEHAKADIKQIKALLLQAPEPAGTALSAGLDILQSTDLRHEFSKLTCPITGVFGRLDALVPAQVVDELSWLNGAFTHKILPKASHAPFISHRQEFITYLKSVL
ncbi:pimeloyl-[acyl-carrier protein] methyl ester esterase [Pseudoalteromonas luteoviolacea]|uniref:Pimeloyl-[acyl-carrier protein] methyl ester esterase n=1 Tax=Pseudoalteromonas luteoviolacea TaxID=43657 RepID=A0A1C0TL83_9GAMM|nr:pimeloyl-ACP methyl ester esterase BioH [Pseudoalteromonas luteoviolacea]OCQ19613.1 pimeloyl-[acyl-carrier protein] methyl ester esterase [Pseudoalteromonas luteoviolacea]